MFYTSMIISSFNVLCIIVAFQLLQIAKCQNHSDDYKHPFPPLFPINHSRDRQLKIVSELVKDTNQYQISEEYIDFNSGKSAFVTTNEDGRKVTYLDARNGMGYVYKPYTCNRTEISNLSRDLLGVGALVKNFTDTKREFRAFGVAGLWLFAMGRNKSFSRNRTIYSGSNESAYRGGQDSDYYSWTVTDDEQKVKIIMSFVGAARSTIIDNQELKLEMIQLESMETGRIVQTININSFDFRIDDETCDDLLELPVGYGCFFSVHDAPSYHHPSHVGLPMKLMIDDSVINLEVTATKLDQRPNAPPVRSIDVAGVEIAHNIYYSTKRINKVYLTRVSNLEQEVKTIMNYKYNVKFEVDVRRGTCNMSHIDGTKFPDVGVDFSNGLHLDLNFETMKILLVDADLVFVKQSKANGSQTSEHFYERTTGSLPKGMGTFRIIRGYIEKGDTVEMKSVTLWKLSQDQTQILESFHINLIDSRMISDWPDEPKIFDISEECYLNNDQMKSGRDYAWLELTYPATDIILNAISKNELEVKKIFYEKFLKDRLDFTRVPRVEIIFEDDGFILRLLLLDSPPLELIYEVEHEVCIEAPVGSSAMTIYAPDLRHCAELCRLNYCAMMSFSPGSYLCIITGDSATRTPPLYHCDTYRLPTSSGISDNLKNFHAESLHNIIARYQHLDYSISSVPKQPDELILPRSESGISETEYSKAKNEYLTKFLEFISKLDSRIPELTIADTIADHFIVLLPNKFELDDDPLNGIDIAGVDDESDGGSHLQAFKGLGMLRYKANKPIEDSQISLRQMMGVTYEQCAIACLDSRCGSISYCQNHLECTLSSINSVEVAYSLGVVEHDFDCYMAQRDFLSSFVKFEQIRAPETFEQSQTASGASECALNCVSKTSYRCLSFDYCPPLEHEGQQNGICYYQKDRFRSGQNSGLEKSGNSSTSSCDHYSRSFLADFNRVEYRRVASQEIFKLKTTEVAGQSVFRCAEMCVNELIDCTAFQFCLNTSSPGAKQECIMIESRPQDANRSDFSAVVDEKSGELVQAGKYLEHDINCQVFSLRKDSSEARLSDMAISVTTDREDKVTSSKPGRINSLLLYVLVSLSSAAIWCALCLVKDKNEFLRLKVERGRILLGLSPE